MARTGGTWANSQWTATLYFIISRSKRILQERWYLHWPVLALFGVLLFRALGRCEAWEAVALGVAPALLLTHVVSYYAIVVALALLAARRPRIGIAVMLALVGWCASAIVFYADRLEFVFSSAIALALLLYTLLEMQWPPAKSVALDQ